jgi:hypothetical protein
MRVFLLMDDALNCERISLENGEVLEIEDKSRKIAEDTWLVTLVFRITISIDEGKKSRITSEHADDITRKLGDTVVYEVRHERNFINDGQKDNVVGDIRDSFLNTNLKYLNHREFAEKFILKKYYEKK